MSYVRKWPLGGLGLAVLWLFIRGVHLDAVHLAEEFLIGLGVGMPIAYGLRRIYRPTVDVHAAARAVPYVGVYVALFLYELLTANLGVAYRVLHPRMPIHPDVVEFPLRVRTDVAITTIANSITLTPGTLTMDYDPELNALYVHAIAAEDREAVVAPIRRWEDYALVIFDEDLDPGDPVPDPERESPGPAGDGPVRATDDGAGAPDAGEGGDDRWSATGESEESDPGGRGPDHDAGPDEDPDHGAGPDEDPDHGAGQGDAPDDGSETGGETDGDRE